MEKTGLHHNDGLCARHWHALDDKRIQCDLCPRECVLKEGQRGYCFVRQNMGHQLRLTAYGHTSGLAVDPIEKKPLYHFYPGSSVLSFGTAGCNLGCSFCQNWNLSKSRDLDVSSQSASPERIAQTALSHGCKSVAFTYNEPLIFLEYAVDTARVCHEKGLSTAAVTAGYVKPGPRKEFFKHIDAANVDLKAFTEKFYKKNCSASLQPVLDTLLYLKNETPVWLEITTLIIPGENDSHKEINSMCQWIAKNLGPSVPLHFSAFHPDWKMTHHPRTPLRTLTQAREIARKNSINFVYIGNVHEDNGSVTYCPQCQEKLIIRDWRTGIAQNLNQNAECLKCESKCPGKF